MHKLLFLFINIFLVQNHYALPSHLNPIVTKKIFQRVEKFQIFSNVEMKTLKNNDQQLDYYILGLHKKNCNIALSRLSQYERYQEFLGFIKKSTYREKSKFIYLQLGHQLLPFNMSLGFKLERIKGPGVYHFEFDSGFLKGLKGTITVQEYKKRCLFETKAKWQGPNTGISNYIFELFSKTLGVMGMEKLFQISQFY